MVVPVLMINCHVSENPKSGPDIAHKTTTAQQRRKVIGFPVVCAIALAAFANVLESFEGSAIAVSGLSMKRALVGPVPSNGACAPYVYAAFTRHLSAWRR